MNLLISFILLLSSLSVLAANPTNRANVTLAWDASPDVVKGYWVYAGTNAALATNTSAALTNAYAGTNLSVVVSNLPPATWYFVATATDGMLESVPSNMAVCQVKVSIAPPSGMRTIFVEQSTDLTNWVDKAFFRVRLSAP